MALTLLLVGVVLILSGLVFPLLLRKPKPVKRTVQPTFDHGLFMPYCACPRCGKEAWHDMRPARTSRDDRRITWDDFTTTIALDFALKMERNFEVFRTCYACNYRWGQNPVSAKELRKMKMTTDDTAK